MHELICPLCGHEIDPSGPGVASDHPENDPDAGWESFWVPFIEDLRTDPTRLAHASCFAREDGVAALVAVVHAHDTLVRRELYHRWRRDQGLDK